MVRSTIEVHVDRPGSGWVRAAFSALALLATLSAPRLRAQDDDYAPDLRAAQNALLRGQFSKARAGFEEILAAAEEEAEGQRPSTGTLRQCRVGLWQMDLAQGKYDEVRAAIEARPAGERGTNDVRLVYGRALARRGEYSGAAAEFAEVTKTDAEDMEARYRLALAQGAVGQHEAAAATLRTVEEAAHPRDGRNLAYRGQCLVLLGGRDNFEAASELFVESLRVAPERPEALTFFGMLKFEAYREASGLRSGETDLKKVLDQNGEREDALVALYRIRRSNFQLDPSRTEDYLRRALALNPKSVPAMTEQAILLLDDRRFEAGSEVLDAALRIDPNDKVVLAHRIAAALLRGDEDGEKELRQRLASIDPAFHDADRLIADHLVALYRFADSVPLYERALAAAPDLVPALDGLGKALAMCGRGSDARAHLEKAKALQPGFVNPWRHNALAVQDLLDKEYRMVERGGFRFFFHKEDFATLSEYLIPLHLEAMEQLGLKYSYQPNGLVRVEALHEWVDFSVRTIGYRGFTALGACFGNFITLVSPVDKDVRRLDFMWSATVWHEYAHVLTLALSRSRVPRWLTEGFSVHEEHARNKAWERGMDRQLFDYWHNDKIYKVRDLNRAFRGPDILFGYFQGGLIVDYLAEKHGFPRVVTMLKAYGADTPEEQIFQDTFGVSTATFDREFKQWVWDTRLADLRLVPSLDDAAFDRTVARVDRGQGSLQDAVALGWASLARGNEVDAARFVRVARLKEADSGAALLLHAELLRRRGAFDEALAAWTRGFAAGADDFDSRLHYAETLEAQGDVDEALRQYQFAKRCWPRCTEQAVSPNLRIARILRKAERGDEAMAELAGFCALTGRAFRPRLELAEFYRAKDQRRLEAKCLEEANEIDPFMRSLHERLGDAYVALERQSEALREYRVAIAVPAKLDREYLDVEAGPPDEAAPEVGLARAAIWVKLAVVYRDLLDLENAGRALDEACKLAPGTEVEDQAERLRAAWRK
ncbi:MAG: hypothetical protein R3F56_15925 [Planctomycetota bacterium]